MNDPVVVAIPAGQWTRVAHNIMGGMIRKTSKAPTSYKWTYRLVGSPAPTLEQDGVVLFGKEEFENIPWSSGVDLYVFAYGKDGSVRVDDLAPSIGLNQEDVQRSAFNEILTAQFKPLAAWSFNANINPAIIQYPLGQINGGTVTHEESFAVLQTGTDPAGEARIRTIKTSRYIPGVGGRVFFTNVFAPGTPDSEQGIGLIDEANGWAFGYNGDRFGLVRRNQGVDNWIYQDVWNRDLAEQLNPQLGNVYQIKYRWLGFGAQYFSIEDQFGNFALVNVIEYANTSTDTSVESASLPLSAWIKNKGNTTNLEMRTPSASAGLDGDALNAALSVTLAEGNAVVTPNPADTYAVISFYNAPTWLGKENNTFVQALRAIFASNGNKTMTFRILANAVPTDGAFNFLNEQVSSVQVNKTFTTWDETAAVQIGYFPLDIQATLPIDLVDAEFFGYPGQYITIVADTNGGQDLRAGVSFRQFL